MILINGQQYPLAGRPVQTTLLDFVRDLGFTGAKEGCAEGECGACTILMVSDNSYQPVNSCLMFVAGAVDREFYTVEALARDGQLCEAQQALADAGGSQCGYCTPGFVMSLFAEQYRPGRTGACDPHALGGNLCRCTGYRPIRDAARSLGPAPPGYFSDRLKQPAKPLPVVQYSAGGTRFDRPASLAECLSLLHDDPAAKLLSGGTDLGVESNLRFSRWPHLIGVEALSELQEFSENEASFTLGAALPLSKIEANWNNPPEAFRQWVPLFASLPIRNRATLGGNLATASPIGDSAPLLLALNASVQLAGTQGHRRIPLSSFFTGYRQTQLQPGELIRAVEITKPFPAFSRFYKASKRRMDDISTVAAGLSMDWDSQGRVGRAVFAFGGVGPVTVRASAAEDAALGQHWTAATLERVQRALERELRPIDDHRGSALYRSEIAKSFLEKFWWEWQERAA